MKRAFIVHGWDGHPNEAWFPWLKTKLSERDFDVQVLQMPTPETPKMETWIPYLASAIGNPDENTFLIGHSMGVQTILRYLETIETPIGGVIAVAGFFTLRQGSIGGPEDEKVAEPWLTVPMDLAKIKKNAANITAIFSDNDKFVPLENVDLFRKGLNAETIVIHNKGHMGSSDNVPELPEVLREIIRIENKQRTTRTYNSSRVGDR